MENFDKEVYQRAREQAMRDYDRLEPVLRQLQDQAAGLKMTIKGTSLIIGGYEDIDDKYKFLPPKETKTYGYGTRQPHTGRRGDRHGRGGDYSTNRTDPRRDRAVPDAGTAQRDGAGMSGDEEEGPSGNR